jgi:16S rRNA (cytosine967-C5)-methyltransferase
MIGIVAIAPARVVAFDILRLVEAGGYASDLLRSRSAGLDPRDASLASEIVFGSLRYRAQLDYLVEQFSGRTVRRLDPEVLTALRMGVYQVRYLERVPSHAAVGESVELVKRAGKRSAAGLVNAVLRKVHRDPVPWSDRTTGLSHPAWLLDRWDRQYGPETAERIARAHLQPPETYVHIAGSPPADVVLEPTEVPGCYRVLKGDPTGLRIQDIGSQAIVPLLDLQPGQVLLDLCAAPGGKTALAIETGVQAIACDLRPTRLAQMEAIGCARVALDATVPLPFSRRFDRILVDAPCSGTGTLARNPDIMLRLQSADVPELHRRQVLLLRNALERLAPGGRLVYSTCSLEREENEAVVEEVGAPVLQLWRRLPGLDPGDGFFAAVITSE